MTLSFNLVITLLIYTQSISSPYRHCKTNKHGKRNGDTKTNKIRNPKYLPYLSLIISPSHNILLFNAVLKVFVLRGRVHGYSSREYVGINGCICCETALLEGKFGSLDWRGIALYSIWLYFQKYIVYIVFGQEGKMEPNIV